MKRILVTVATVSLLMFPSLASADGFSGSDGSFEHYTHSGHGYGGYRGYGNYGYFRGGHGRVDVGSAVAVGIGLAIVGTILNQAANDYYYGDSYGPYDTYESDYYYDDRGAYYAPVRGNECNGRRDVTSTATYGNASCAGYRRQHYEFIDSVR